MNGFSLPRPAIDYAALSVAGRVRSRNEDALLCRPDLGLWAIADGMGGHQRGELASATAVRALESCIEAGLSLVDAVHQANAAILRQAADEPDSEGMGSTLVAVSLAANGGELAWVGDSRAYLLGTGGIEQLSHDHSWVQSLVDAGELSAEEARVHPGRNLILQCLGRNDQDLEVDSRSLRLAPGELLLLCSDGLSGELEDARIRELCGAAGTLEEVVESLVAAAEEAGGRDNISCIVLGCRAGLSPLGKPGRGLFGRLLARCNPFSRGV